MEEFTVEVFPHMLHTIVKYFVYISFSLLNGTRNLCLPSSPHVVAAFDGKSELCFKSGIIKKRLMRWSKYSFIFSCSLEFTHQLSFQVVWKVVWQKSPTSTPLVHWNLARNKSHCFSRLSICGDGTIVDRRIEGLLSASNGLFQGQF